MEMLRHNYGIKCMNKVLIDAALSSGAGKAALIAQDKIVLNAMFRDICAANGCGNYGNCYTCPPEIGDIHELMDQVRQFPHGLLYQTITPIEDSFDFEGMMDAGKEHAQVSQRIQSAMSLLLKKPILHLAAGGCHLCDICAKRLSLPCRHPSQVLPPLEGYGVDVYQTSLSTDLHYTNGPNTVTYFGLVLFTE